MKKDVVLEIGDFLGFCDMNGLEAITSKQIQDLEEYISICNESYHSGDPLVSDAIWDRLMEILRKVSPESELVQHIWEDSTDPYQDTDTLVRQHPMYSIQTVKSFDCDEIKAFVDRLPSSGDFDAHVSVKLNGHGIRLIYKFGKFYQARSRARSSAGRDITKQLAVVLENLCLDELYALETVPLCEIRGEWVLPFANLAKAREYNPDIKSAFSAVASMGRDSATPDEWGLLSFVAYEVVADGFNFPTKQAEYDFIEEMGFEVPMNWVIEGLSKDSLINDLKESIVPDCEAEVAPGDNGSGYAYYTDGLVFAINDSDMFRSLGDDGGHYKYGNMALKVGYWKQDTYSGYVQCIMWTKGKMKLSPVAIVAEDPEIIELEDGSDRTYIYSSGEVVNWSSLGVITASGNKVRRIPLYEPNNIVVLEAYPGHVLHFRYGGEAGVIPCFENGTPLIDGRIKQVMSDDDLDFMDYESFLDGIEVAE